jgi:predicted nucleotidyltransferase
MRMNELLFDEAEKEFLRSLTSRKVRYVLIGGHTVNFYGVDRPVGDLDIVIEPSEENAKRFLLVLQDIRMTGAEVTVENLIQPKMKLTIPFYNIDVLTSVDPVPFHELYQDRVVIKVDGVEISVISKEHLLGLKQSSNRAKDQRDYDALTLQARRGASADSSRLPICSSDCF